MTPFAAYPAGSRASEPSAGLSNRDLGRTLARFLCEVTVSVLWELYGDRVRAAQPGARLHVRVGEGKRTCHTSGPPGSHTITYGRLMAESKLENQEQACLWRTGKELVARGYFRGDATLPNVLAQTVCHEFAHLIQTVEGGRTYRSVHNPAFYRVLGEIHADGAADLVREQFVSLCANAGIELSWSEEGDAEGEPEGAGGATLPVPAAALLPRTFHPGDRVSFEDQGTPRIGTVKRVNRKSLTVIPDHPDHSGQYWLVSPQLLKRVSDDPPSPSPVRSPAPPVRFRVGQRVTFVHQGQPRAGRIIRVNRLTCSVRLDGQTDGYWRIPKSMLSLETR